MYAPTQSTVLNLVHLLYCCMELKYIFKKHEFHCTIIIFYNKKHVPLPITYINHLTLQVVPVLNLVSGTKFSTYRRSVRYFEILLQSTKI